MINETVLVYSSHNCSQFIHEQKIVNRALAGWSNKQILFLPISEVPHPDGNEFESQHFGFNKFNWFFNRYTQYGLEVIPFYFSSYLKPSDVDALVHFLETAEVVILGGGQSIRGIERFRWLGANFYNDPEIFGNLLHERQERGLYTVGFSAGADQLAEYLFSSVYHDTYTPFGFGLAKNIVVSLHFEPSRSEDVFAAAQRYGHCFAFGLPNDSALAISQRVLDSGRFCQIIECIIDTSWDIPQDSIHIKTRHGVKINHFYPDGRHWAFNHGDIIVRIMDLHNGGQMAYLVFDDVILDYWDHHETDFHSIEEIINCH